MKILVLGGTGMLGSALSDVLFVEKNNVIWVGNGTANLTNENETNKLFDEVKPDIVYHCAAMVGGIGDNNKKNYQYMLKNAQMTINAINAAEKMGIEKFFYISSSCAYPRNCAQPMISDDFLTGPFEPTNEGYAMSKMIGILLCKFQNIEYKRNYKSYNLCNLYGPRDNFTESGHVMSSLIRKFVTAAHYEHPSVTLWGDGSARREFLHVYDAANAIYHLTLGDYSDTINYNVNVGSGFDISIRALAEMIAESTKYSGEIIWDTTKPNGMPRKLMDDHVLAAANWKPLITLKEGVDVMIEYYREKYIVASKFS